MGVTTTSREPRERIRSAYLARTPGSAEAAARAQRVFPGGDTRSSAHHAPYPLTLVRGSGSRLWDVDGNDYLDLIGNYTSLVHGNAYPPIVEAVGRASAAGSAWAARNVPAVELAEMLAGRVASVESIRFTNSGTEAAMLAIHLAKLITGRPRILMARHGYHGSHEDTEAGTFAGTRTDALLGGPDGQQHQTWVAEFGDAESFERVLEEAGHEVAAVLLEPVQGSGGLRPATSDFFVRVQAAARSAGSLLILDEVVTFRLAEGGAQQLLGLHPDLTLFGKLIGGGYPVGAVGGRRDVLAVTDPEYGHWLPTGTFNGNPVTAAAGVASVAELTQERIDAMAVRAERLESGLRATAARHDYPLAIRRAGSMLMLSTSTGPQGLSRKADPLTSLLHLAATTRGLHFSPRGLLALSTVLTDAEIVEATERFGLAMAEVMSG